MSRDQTDASAARAVTTNPAIREPSINQLPLLELETRPDRSLSHRERLVELLSGDLDYHNYDTSCASHDFHAFPAKFPPQLPEKFILGLTDEGDVVLDPMMGSGTTVLEATLHRRNAIGFDIDPLARLISKVKCTPLDAEEAFVAGKQVVAGATGQVSEHRDELVRRLGARWDANSLKFVDYWFAPETQVELLALLLEIESTADAGIRSFLELALSACIITKSGGVSMAFDLAHTRPHRAKVVYDQSGRIILGEDLSTSEDSRVQFLTKKLKSPIQEFRKRVQQNIASIQELRFDLPRPEIYEGSAQSLSLPANSVDLIVTSPPYASNAIDYMRAHKFSLVWLGYPVDDLSFTRSHYIGGESTADFEFEDLPPHAVGVIKTIAARDEAKGRVIHRYYSEMLRVLCELYRVLKPGKCSIIVVASSVMRGIDTETDKCLAEIATTVGFEVPKIGVRHLDRNKRMMPAGMKIDRSSQIQQRMHEEYVIGCYKPEQSEQS